MMDVKWSASRLRMIDVGYNGGINPKKTRKWSWFVSYYTDKCAYHSLDLDLGIWYD